jgi:hypothetical protein
MVLGDGDPSAIVTSLWVVKKGDARQVEVMDLMQDGMAQLLNLHPKSLNKSQQRWHISEKELYAMVYGVRKFGQFVSTMVAKWAITSNKKEWTWLRGQLTVPTPKVVFGSDSSSALGMLLTLMCPAGKVDYITPKLARMMMYADDCACTLYWPMARLQLPGGGQGPCNSLCDFLCRLVGQLKRMQGCPTDEDSDEEGELPYDDEEQLVLAVLVHEGESDDVPTGMQLRNLMLGIEQWEELHRAYGEDSASKYMSVRILDVYRVYNGGYEGSQDTKRTIEAWKGKLFFPMMRGGAYVLFTLATAMRLVDVEMVAVADLVLVVPAAAAVQVSRNEVPDAEAQQGVAVWEFKDMRTDIMWWAHQGKWPHAKRVATAERAMSIAWWPELLTEANYHATTCTVCVPHMQARIEIGLGQGAIRPFYVVQMDDKHIPHDIIAASGGRITSVAVLCFTCIATGVTVFCARPNFSSQSAAVCFFVHWFKRFGGCAVLWHDNAAPYLADMMATVAHMCGTQRQITSTKASHAMYAEQRLGVLTRVFREAAMQGQLRTEQDLLLAITGAEMEINHFTLCDGATPMERAGLVAMSSSELVAPSEWQLAIPNMTVEEVLSRVKDADSAEIALAIRDRCEALQGWHRVGQDKRARANFSRRVAANERKHGFAFMHENEGMQLGDVVDWEGQLWKYIRDDGKPEPIRVFLEKVKAPMQGVQKWAMVQELRPMAIGRGELNLPRSEEGEYELLDMVAYEWEDEIHVGLVLAFDVEGSGLTVHVLEHRQGKAGITYVLNWTGGAGGKPDRRVEACPEGYTADIRRIQRSVVCGRVALMGNHRLTEESKRFLESLEVETHQKGQ